MDADAIILNVRGVLLGSQGNVRTVPAALFGEGVHEDLNDDAKWIRAKVRPRFDVKLSPSRPTGAVAPRTANRAVLAIDVIVTLTYASGPTEDLIDARRNLIRAQAAENALTVQQALEWPSNLPQASTGLISSRLSMKPGWPRISREDWAARIYEVELAFDGLVLETQAVA